MRTIRPGELRVDAEHLERAIDAILHRRPGLQRHRRGARFASALLFAMAATRAFALSRSRVDIGSVSWLTLAMLLVGAVGAAIQATRTTRRLNDIQQKLFTLLFLRD